MAPIRVAGELYADIDGQMWEIKRQLRQKEGYPYDPMQLVEHLQAAIEGNLVDRHGQPFKKASVQRSSRIICSFTITCNGGLKTSELVEAGEYNWKNDLIGDNLFPIKPHASLVRKIELVECDFDLISEEALVELNRHGLKRPTAEDAFQFGIDHPGEQRKHSIVFLHEPALGPLGSRDVLVLGGDVGGRTLSLDWFGRRWHRRYVFAGVRKSLYFLSLKAGVSFKSCLFHPPSILPISKSFSESSMYFLLSTAFISQATCKKNFSTSSFTSPFLR